MQERELAADEMAYKYFSAVRESAEDQLDPETSAQLNELVAMTQAEKGVGQTWCLFRHHETEKYHATGKAPVHASTGGRPKHSNVTCCNCQSCFKPSHAHPHFPCVQPTEEHLSCCSGINF